MRLPYEVTIALEVHSRGLLYRAAKQRAIKHGLDVRDWHETRRRHGDRVAADLIMLLDPGSVLAEDGTEAGVQITDSSVESA